MPCIHCKLFPQNSQAKTGMFSIIMHFSEGIKLSLSREVDWVLRIYMVVSLFRPYVHDQADGKEVEIAH